jgi:hypothetical protein
MKRFNTSRARLRVAGGMVVGVPLCSAESESSNWDGKAIAH